MYVDVCTPLHHFCHQSLFCSIIRAIPSFLPTPQTSQPAYGTNFGGCLVNARRLVRFWRHIKSSVSYAIRRTVRLDIIMFQLRRYSLHKVHHGGHIVMQDGRHTALGSVIFDASCAEKTYCCCIMAKCQVLLRWNASPSKQLHYMWHKCECSVPFRSFVNRFSTKPTI